MGIRSLCAVREGIMTASGQPRTLLHVLLANQEIDYSPWSRFRVLWRSMAKDAARGLGIAELGNVPITEPTFKRWRAGKHVPRGNTRLILEYYFGMSIEKLLGPAPVREVVPSRPLHRRTHTAAHVLDYSWPTSRLIPDTSDAEIGGLWGLASGRYYDGTAIGVQLYEAEPHGDAVAFDSADRAHLESFLRSSRRGVVLASLGAAGGNGLYVMDATLARRSLTAGQELRVPLAYQLDDLTYAIIWALHVLDEGLLADDYTLSDQADELRHYVVIKNAPPSGSEMSVLTPSGAAWLGSSLCAQYVIRHLDDLPEVPKFWTREATGEECVPWLFFRHNHAYLQAVADRFGGSSTALSRAFCVPESAVQASEPYERILLFLTVAMMELHGVKVWMCDTPELAEIKGFVLARDYAILASWVRERELWRVGRTTGLSKVASYQKALDHAQANSLLEGPTATDRLQALAAYLNLDWAWLINRCHALGRPGISRMLRPRSRLVTLTALDRCLRYIGTLRPPQGR